MIAPQAVFSYLEAHGVSLVTGVPDSLLKHFCAFVADHLPPERHIITANEGGAVALAAGHHLATGEYALVYMQNSGLGNAINPLLSLADVEVYSIPMLLMIGWRGEPGVRDEPQHVKQGRVTLSMLDVMEIPYVVLDAECNWKLLIGDAVWRMKREQRPVALVVRKDTFQPHPAGGRHSEGELLTREQAIHVIVEQLDPTDIVVSTTGMTSRELYEIREKRSEGHSKDFLTVGSMGHSSQIALGIACGQPERQIVCLDGDGSVLMHMGGMAIVGQVGPKNFLHIVLDNAAHDSVGGQPTASPNVSFLSLAKSLGYRQARGAVTKRDITQSISDLRKVSGPSLLWVKVQKGARPDLGRPKTTPVENKNALMRQLLG